MTKSAACLLLVLAAVGMVLIINDSPKQDQTIPAIPAARRTPEQENVANYIRAHDCKATFHVPRKAEFHPVLNKVIEEPGTTGYQCAGLTSDIFLDDTPGKE